MTNAVDWVGRVGDAWAADWSRVERAFAGIALALDFAIDSVAPVAGRAVDVGSGAGSTAITLAAARPALDVIGIDLSESLLNVARARTGGADRPRFVRGDALAVLPDLAPVDLIVSRHGVMFFADPLDGFQKLHAAATPCAPLVFSCFRGRRENTWSHQVENALGVASTLAQGYAPGPFALADRDFTTAILSGAGWQQASAVAIDAEFLVGAGDDPIEDAVRFFLRIGPVARVLAEATPGDRAAKIECLRGFLESRRTVDAVTFTAAAWIWTAYAGDHR